MAFAIWFPVIMPARLPNRVTREYKATCLHTYVLTRQPMQANKNRQKCARTTVVWATQHENWVHAFYGHKFSLLFICFSPSPRHNIFMTIPSLRVAFVCLTLTHLPFTYTRTHAHFYTLTEINTFKWDCTRVRVMLLSLLMPAFMLHVRVCVCVCHSYLAVVTPPPPSLLVIVKEQKPKNSEG